jgi:hypothetical protein
MSNIATWTDEFLDRQRQAGDPEADEIMQAIVEEEGHEEARFLFDQLIGQLELPLEGLPPSARSFISRHQSLPSEADPEQIAIANAFFTDHGPKLLFCLFYASLPLLYSCANGAQVLVHTSRLTNREEDLSIFARRIAETGQFLLDTMRPGGLNRRAIGIQSVLKVRLIHAAIRHFAGMRAWDQDTLGLPINQEDMALTLMTFCIAPIRGLEKFDIEVSAEQKQAYTHIWAAVGQLMGVNKALLPQSYDEGAWLMDKILQRQSASSEAGQLLARALIDFGNRALNSGQLAGTPQAIIQFLIGPQYAKMLNVAPEGCLSQLVPGVLRTAFKLGERLEDQIDGPLRAAIEYFSKRTTQGLVNYFDEYPDRQFQVPLAFRKAWLQD